MKDSLKQFFLLRITECFNKNTIDSYRVRSNNTITLLYESRDVIKSWCKHRIKSFETVKYVLEESTYAINKSTCLTFDNCPKELLIKEIEEYKKTESFDNVKASHLLYYIELCIEENASGYLNRLFTSIRQLLAVEGELDDKTFQSQLEKIDRNVTELACELIRVGYSKIYLFYYFQSLVKEMAKKEYKTFLDKYDEFSRDLISCNLGLYSVVFILSVPKDYVLMDGFSDSISNDILNKIDVDKRKQFQQNNTRKFFYIRDVEALDEYCAIKKVREEISQILDFRQNGPEHQIIRIPYNAFVGRRNDDNMVEWYKSRIVYSLDISRLNTQDSVNALSDVMDNIVNNKMVDDESISRIKSALRHLRIGDGQLEMEQRFINYWIGLEFLFSSPEISDSTFIRMKQYLISIMSSCYVKRNILNLVHWMKDFDCSIDVFKEDNSIDNFISGHEINVLMFYRLKRMKMHLHHTDKTKDYISNHRRNLEQHLSRLYRFRNELVHEGALKHNMESVTSNLRYYLVFILNQTLDYFSHNRSCDIKLTMDSFFGEYEKNLQFLLMNKGSNLKYDNIMRVPLQSNFLK